MATKYKPATYKGYRIEFRTHRTDRGKVFWVNGYIPEKRKELSGGATKAEALKWIKNKIAFNIAQGYWKDKR